MVINGNLNSWFYSVDIRYWNILVKEIYERERERGKHRRTKRVAL